MNALFAWCRSIAESTPRCERPLNRLHPKLAVFPRRSTNGSSVMRSTRAPEPASRRPTYSASRCLNARTRRWAKPTRSSNWPVSGSHWPGAPGRTVRPWNGPRWTGWTGSTTTVCWGRSGTSRQQRPKRSVIGARNVRPPRPDSNHTAPDIPGAVHGSASALCVHGLYS